MDSKTIKKNLDEHVAKLRDKGLNESDIEEATHNLREMYEVAYEEEQKALDKEIDSNIKGLEAKFSEQLKAGLEEIKKEFGEPKEDSRKKQVYGYKKDKSLEELITADSKTAKKEKQAVWFQNIIKMAIDPHDEAARTVVKALSEGTDALGGHLVPEEFRMDLIEDLRAESVFRRISTIFPMSSKTLELPKLAVRPEVYWTSENVTGTTTSASFGNLVLTARKLLARIYTSTELAEDSSPAVVDLLRRLFVQAIREAEEQAFTSGNGTTRPKGITQETITSISAGGALTSSHLVSVKYLLGQGYRNRASWMMNSRTWANILNLKSTDGSHLVDPNVLKSDTTPVLLGRPVYENDNLPSSEVYFGDFSFYYIGDRGQISIDTSTEADNTFARDQVQIRARERVDGRTALTGAFRKITSTGVS